MKIILLLLLLLFGTREAHGHLATLNMIFSVTYYLDLHGAIMFSMLV